MKAANVKLDYSLLRTIHRILKQKADLAERIHKGPRRITTAENAERQFADELAKARENRTKIQMLADEKQLQLSEREAKIKDLQSKLNTAESNREYQLLKDQIAADEQANSVLSDEILELLERLDVIEATVNESADNLAKAQQETEKVRQQVAGELANLQEQMDSVIAELAGNEAKLTGEVAAEYKRLVDGRGEDALAETDMQTCGLCFTKLTTQAMSELLMQQVVFCKSCGCLLYPVDKQRSFS